MPPVSFRPSAASGEIFGNYSARALYSLFGNTNCILPPRGGAKTRSTPRRLRRRSAQGDTKRQTHLSTIQMRVPKPRLWKSALNLSHSVAFLRLNPERVNLRDFLIGEALIIRVSRKSQGAARDFWERGETVPQRLRIAFRQTAATRVLFRRARREKTKCRAAAGEPCGGEHLVVF